MTEILVGYCTVPDEKTARKIAHTLVEEDLAACVSMVPYIQSIYKWQGTIHEDKEVLLMIKTCQKTWKKMKDRIMEIHPYEVPEIIATPIIEGNDKYVEWVLNTSNGNKTP